MVFDVFCRMGALLAQKWADQPPRFQTSPAFSEPFFYKSDKFRENYMGFEMYSASFMNPPHQSITG